LVAEISLFQPDWPAPASVRSAITHRAGGHSLGRFGQANLALHVGDDADHVRANRAQLMTQLGIPHIQWLEQIHGIDLVQADTDGLTRTADGAISHRPGLACAVLTADCLPILMCDQQGRQVAAVHAGWRGLAQGIVDNAVRQFDLPADQLLAYLGPAIGPAHFEVGIEVLEAFFDLAATEPAADAIAQAFTPASRPLKFYANLYQLARLALQQSGVQAIYGGDTCTYGDSARFYSYRRDGETGRMASLIWIV
jgi:polyphenol oxidase